MPPVGTFVALLGNGVSFGAALTASFGTLGAALLQVGGSLLLSAASRALMPQPHQGLQGRTETVRAPVMPRDLVYGFVRKSGTVVFIATGPGSAGTVNEDLHIVILLATHQVHAIGGIYLNGELAADYYGTAVGRYAGWLEVNKALGSPTQTAFPRLNQLLPADWTAQHRLQGCAALYLRLVYNPDVYPQGIPNVTVDLWGKNDIYDPRTGARGYSDNPALCLADYMADANWGLGAAIGAEDGVNAQALIDAANACEELVPHVAGGTENRYTCNGVITLSQTPKTIIEAMLTAMAGTCAFQGSDWNIFAGVYRPPVLTFGEDDVVDGGMQITTRVSMAENFNAVRGQFVAPENDWQPDDFPAYESAVYLAEDSGVRKYRDINLPFTTSSSMAQRLAKIELERNRRQFAMSFDGKLGVWRATVGDTAMVTYARWGFLAKPYDVRGMSLQLTGDGDGLRLVPQITLRETSPLVYDWLPSEAQIYAAAPRTTLPSAFDIDPPSGLTVGEQLYQTLDGSGIKALARISWVASASAFAALYQVEARIGVGAWQLVGRTDQTTMDYLDIAPAIWEFRVKALSAINVSSPWVSWVQEIFGLGAPPAALVGVTLQSAGGSAILKWALPADLDVRVGGTVEIRHSVAAVPVWANSVGMDIVSGSQAIAVVPLKPGTYLLRAVDASGVPGPEVAVSASGAQALTFAGLSTLTEDSAFSGTKSGVVASAGALTLDSSSQMDLWASFDAVVNVDFEGGIVPSGTYSFASGMDLGTAKLIRLRSVIDMIAVDLFNTVDARVGNIDSWAGFDGVDGGEVDVLVEARLTQTDPSASPTWGPWSRVDSTEVQARGIQARAILSSADATFTPSVTQLRLIAEEVV